MSKKALTVDDSCGQDGRHASLLGEELELRVQGSSGVGRLLLHRHILILRGGGLFYIRPRQHGQETLSLLDLTGHLAEQLLSWGRGAQVRLDRGGGHRTEQLHQLMRTFNYIQIELQTIN